MIGNDIVDLKKAAKDSNWQRRGFLDKTFTTEEQGLIFSAKNKDQMVWLLWSIKEAAYKVYVQETETPFFNPKQLKSCLVSETEGLVSVFGFDYTTTSEITDDWIHSYTISQAKSHPDEEKKTGFSKSFSIDETSFISQSTAVRRKLIDHVSKANKIPKSHLKVAKDSCGIPFLKIADDPLKKRFSLSHHGRFGAFAIC